MPKKQSTPEQTRFDAFVLRCKNNKWIAPVLILFLILGGIAQFTDAIGKIRNFIKPTASSVLTSQSMINSPGSMQAGRDIVINSSTSEKLGEPTNHVFSITALSFEYEPNETAKDFLVWRVQIANTEKYEIEALSPINAKMTAQIINLKHYPLKINSFQFEGKTVVGNWEIMPIVDPRIGPLISILNGKTYICDPQKMGVSLDNFSPANFDGKTIDNEKQINGFLYLESPNDKFAGKIRLRISTPEGEFVEPVVVKDSSNTFQTRTHESFPVLGYVPLPIDISKIPIKPYPEQFTNRFGSGF